MVNFNIRVFHYIIRVAYICYKSTIVNMVLGFITILPPRKRRAGWSWCSYYFHYCESNNADWLCPQHIPANVSCTTYSVYRVFSSRIISMHFHLSLTRLYYTKFKLRVVRVMNENAISHLVIVFFLFLGLSAPQSNDHKMKNLGVHNYFNLFELPTKIYICI